MTVMFVPTPASPTCCDEVPKASTAADLLDPAATEETSPAQTDGFVAAYSKMYELPGTAQLFHTRMVSPGLARTLWLPAPAVPVPLQA